MTFEGPRCACDKYLVYRDGLCWNCWNAKRESEDPAVFVTACIEGGVEHTVEWTKPEEAFDFGDKDFTVQFSFPTPPDDRMFTVDGSYEPALSAEDDKGCGWHHFELLRPVKPTTTFHGLEEFEGELFQSARVYDSDHRLIELRLFRADLVKG